MKTQGLSSSLRVDKRRQESTRAHESRWECMSAREHTRDDESKPQPTGAQESRQQRTQVDESTRKLKRAHSCDFNKASLYADSLTTEISSLCHSLKFILYSVFIFFTQVRTLRFTLCLIIRDKQHSSENIRTWSQRQCTMSCWLLSFWIGYCQIEITAHLQPIETAKFPILARKMKLSARGARWITYGTWIVR